MIKTSSSQLSIEGFLDPEIGRLNPENRWVKLANSIPWAELGLVYESKMSTGKGSPCKPARLVIGALIVKHKLNVSDAEAIEQIKENPYLQYFVGLGSFTTEKAFDPSLFTTVRKRLGYGDFNRMSSLLQHEGIRIAEGDRDEGSKDGHSGDAEDDKRVVSCDATVAPQEIPYPTDLGLLATARVQSEKIIDLLWPVARDSGLSKKPRTYRDKAHREYVGATRKKRKGAEFWRVCARRQLNYLERNLRHIDSLIEANKGVIRLKSRFLKILMVLHEIARQQSLMLETGANRVDGRIVNVFQPHVRPIVRGKNGSDTEFGAKLSVSLHEGYSYLDKAQWDAYYEGDAEVIRGHIDSFGERNPEMKLGKFVGDKIYGNRNARQTMSGAGVEFVGSPLGRPPSSPEKIRERKENRALHQRHRSRAEGKFGEVKRGLGLDKIQARRADTSLSWIACIFFVANLKRFQSEIFFDLVFLSWKYGIWLQDGEKKQEKTVWQNILAG
ncbi:transposase (plasmid) [Fulvitalea axinellae]|uniref:Transposase n=1 Tax=Fulvitalea axinellae TaxID=1182444 RepID=A0AAU9CMZ9_9BACT|nr:transposase [Fulvitalea axinellae]BDD08033.1 transposase [Fulvitalea axinellae]BDD08267.1 transposase [Fulvitalea axinellae]BDD11769.1 transposase [Fulvitalea axinellae]BDD12164.1 transposase [Fulvitalea axinellae]